VGGYAHTLGRRCRSSGLEISKARTCFVSLPAVDEVILAAPDIDAEVFKRDIAPALAGTGRPITLYASSEDLALRASKTVHGYPRAGDSGRDLVVISGIETVDATTADTSFLGHSYIGSSRSVLSDMSYLIREGLRADRRHALDGVDSEHGRHWIFRP
jgi:esterase/lipase superfamily enzyme